jgi:hypothetical protein
MRKPLVLLLLAALTMPAGSARADTDITVGDVRFAQTSTGLFLGDSRISRSWVTGESPVAGSPIRTAFTTEVRDVRTGARYRSVATPEARVRIDGATVTTDELSLRSADAEALPNGIALTLRFDAVPASGQPLGFGIEKRITLYDGASAFESRLAVVNATPSAHRVYDFRLDALSPLMPPQSAEVERYVGGSDWRDDFRTIVPKYPAVGGAFDEEGQVLRFGEDAGWYFVSERRGGAASRVGYDGQTTWVGADYARDLEDMGPLATTPPNYNRVENPAYPAPVRGRLLAPGARLELGTVATGVYSGGAQEAAASYVDYLVRYRQPKYHHDVVLNSFHPWSHGAEFNGTTMAREAETMAALGADEIILDDQWQGGPGGESGDWHWDPERFPDDNHNGLPDIVDRIRALHLKLGLWMSPAEFNAVSQTFFEHPDWACTPIGTATGQVPDDAGLGVWDFNNPALRAYVTNTIARLVRDYDVAEFKFDFQTWVDCPPYDYNDYEAAFASWIDDLTVRFPQVSFEFDETNDQRMYAFESVARGPSWFDNFHTHTLPGGERVKQPSQVLHDIWMAAPWIPPATLGVGAYNDGVGTTFPVDFHMAAAALTHWTFWYDIAGVRATNGLTPEQFDATKWWIGWYHAHRDALGGLVYRLSADDPWDSVAPAAFQPWNGTSGYLFAFRQAGAAPVAALRGLDRDASYTLTNVRTGDVLGTYSGVALMGGLNVPLATPFSAAVYSITPAL